MQLRYSVLKAVPQFGVQLLDANQFVHAQTERKTHVTTREISSKGVPRGGRVVVIVADVIVLVIAVLLIPAVFVEAVVPVDGMFDALVMFDPPVVCNVNAAAVVVAFEKPVPGDVEVVGAVELEALV